MEVGHPPDVETIGEGARKGGVPPDDGFVLDDRPGLLKVVEEEGGALEVLDELRYPAAEDGNSGRHRAKEDHSSREAP